MASRKDQLHSYQFLLQRVVSALIMRETDPAQAPLRRGVGALFVGVMIAVIVAAGFGIYGLLTKAGSGKWQVDHAVLVEKETGATFVYSAGTTPVLTPTLNYTSALLLSGQSPPAVFRVARKSLVGIRRDVPRGIADAPDALPSGDRITRTPWTLCAAPSQDVTGNRITTTQLAVGRAPIGGRPLDDQALLVQDARTAQIALVWHSHRYHVTRPETVLPSLFGAQNELVPVGTAWLNGLPAGDDIGPISVPGRGASSPAVPGRRVGDVLFDRVGTGQQQFYLVLADGLAPVTLLQKDILLGQSPVTPTEVSAAQVNQTTKSARSLSSTAPVDAQPPDQAPPLAVVTSDDRAVCSEYVDARSAPRVLVDTASGLAPGTATGSQTGLGTSLADFVAVPGGSIGVVEAMASPTAPSGAISIVTDIGVRFPVPSVDVLKTLGYSAAAAVQMPASLVNRIPAGPTLSPDAATRVTNPTTRPGGG
jgi:type VII secretion protein EccB